MPASLALSLEQAKQALLYKQQIAEKLAKLNLPLSAPSPSLPVPLPLSLKAEPSPRDEARQWTPLRLDELGRQVDASGNVISMKREAELKVNQQLAADERKDKRVKEKPAKQTPADRVPSLSDAFVDPTLPGINGRGRSARALRFVPAGTHEKQAALMRRRLVEQAMEEARAATEEPPTSAAKAEVMEAEEALQPQSFVIPTTYDPVPEMEPWDLHLTTSSTSFTSVPSKLTSLVYHPIPVLSLTPSLLPPPKPILLTVRERKKLKRRAKMEKAKETTEKIRLGLIPPPPPKLRLSNLMNALINGSVAEPSEMERRVREEMRERVEKHERANADRKLSAEAKKEKVRRKMREKTTDGAVHVHVYAVRRGLGGGRVRYLLDVNAAQWNLTGVGVLIRQSGEGSGGGDDERNGVSVVVVEGGPKGLRRFQRLMLSRIDWKKEVERERAEAAGADGAAGMSDDDDDSDDEDEGVEHRNTRECALVWQGMVAKHAFVRFGFEVCRSETMARQTFAKLGVEHYFDLARATKLDEADGD